MEIRRPKYLTFFIHVACWVVLYSIHLLLTSNQANNHPEPPNHLIHTIWFYSLLIVVFYINWVILIPKVLLKKGFGQYLMWVAAILAVVAFINLFVCDWIDPNAPRRFHRYMIIFPALFMMAVGTSIYMSMDLQKREQQQSEMENERLNSELAFLRSQVSPHFMFNVMNSMVSLARKKSDNLEPIIIKLSQIMRYMLYESDERKVPLKKENEYIQSYIELQQLRFGDDIQIIFHTEGEDGSYMIEPMLLIPFVENAFKHGSGYIQNPMIDIDMKVRQGKLKFTVKNKYSKEPTEEKDADSGIGLANVKRRLDLLYQNKYQLDIREDGEWFTAALTLDLHA